MANVVRGKIKKANDSDPKDYMVADESDDKAKGGDRHPFSGPKRVKQIKKVKETRKQIMADLFED